MFQNCCYSKSRCQNKLFFNIFFNRLIFFLIGTESNPNFATIRGKSEVLEVRKETGGRSKYQVSIIVIFSFGKQS